MYSTLLPTYKAWSFRDEQFTFHVNSHDLPKPLFGHCQLHIGNERVFVYGGTTLESINGSKSLMQPSNEDFI